MAKKNAKVVEEIIQENISLEPLENVMSDRYATYAKYVIQDRAIPDVRDGLKPVQRRIIFSMYKSGNTFNKPTRKCAHTVGAVMGTFHPHGDTSIYEALARMSQDWKVRYPLINFQGNNGSIDGDQPAAYRYTESRLAELSNELIRDIDKKTVDMQLNFDDTELEPTVLPARFPNLFVNGTEGIAVALATEIPPHNLRELIDAIIYRINHKNATVEDLLQFVQGPDFPGGGIIYRSEGLKNIYLTGRGRIEVAARTEIVPQKDIIQIIITEIPYKVVKSQLVYEIDKIIHAKSVSGMIEIRDESDWKGIRIVIDCKKDAKADLLLKYLMNKTPLLTSYSANIVAIVDGTPKTLSLIDYVDSYIAHQVDVVLRKSKFDLAKFSERLHIVDGLITASLNINEVVDIIKKSKDKADSKVNLMKRFGFSNEQAEAIVTMPLYKLSHTDEEILLKEKKQLEADIETLKTIIEDPNKLNRVIVKDLRAIADKYGDERRTTIEEKGEVGPIDKRQLIAKEECYISLTRDGYLKRSSVKSYRGSGENALPGIKSGDTLVTYGSCFTTDYLLSFTNLGNYVCIPVHKLTDNKWKDEGTHLNTFVTLGPGEKIIKGFAVSDFRNDICFGILTKFGQIKRMLVSSLVFSKRSRPLRCMKLLNGDEVVGVQILTGNCDLLVITSNGNASLFNENDLTILGSKAGGVKSIAQLGKNSLAALLAFTEGEKSKFVVITDKAHERVSDNNRFPRTNRLGKVQLLMPCFKGDIHKIVAALKVKDKTKPFTANLCLSDQSVFNLLLEDLSLTDAGKYAKKNISIPARTFVNAAYDTDLERIDKALKSYLVQQVVHPDEEEAEESANEEVELLENETVQEEAEVEEAVSPVEENPAPVVEKKEKKKEEKNKDKAGTFEQMNLFDDLD
ncbi:MAG: DNA topoisomerase 4 subunit A [Bacilli bacterium]|nr:DNA topoisomerase 4 subunit A [Bacilli bacterium]